MTEAQRKVPSVLASRTLAFIDRETPGAFSPNQVEVLNRVVEPLVEAIEALQARADQLEGKKTVGPATAALQSERADSRERN